MLDNFFDQVIRKFKMIAENNSYFLNVGPKWVQKIFYMSEFSLSLFTLLANLLFAMKSSSSAGSSSHYNRVDVAFICMCAFAIDELFSDDWSRWKTIKHFGQKIPLGDYLPSLSVPIEMPNYHQENNVNTHVISCKMNVIFNFNISMQENITLKHS